MSNEELLWSAQRLRNELDIWRTQLQAQVGHLTPEMLENVQNIQNKEIALAKLAEIHQARVREASETEMNVHRLDVLRGPSSFQPLQQGYQRPGQDDQETKYVL